MTTTTTTTDTAETVRQLAMWSATTEHARVQFAAARARLYTAVRNACEEGMPVAAVARNSGLDRATVRRLRDQPTKP